MQDQDSGTPKQLEDEQEALVSSVSFYSTRATSGLANLLLWAFCVQGHEIAKA